MKRSERNSVRVSTQTHKHIINRKELLVEFDGEKKRVVNKCTENPIPTGRYVGPPENDLTGRKFGSLTVIGRYAHNKAATYIKANWVCRCECGMYEVRKSRSIRNPNNQSDSCHICRQIKYVKRHKKFLESAT